MDSLRALCRIMLATLVVSTGMTALPAHAQVITTIAGRHRVQGFAGDGGPATSAVFNLPRDIESDAEGNLYIADSGNHRVRKLTLNPDGTYTASTVVGNGTAGFSGDGGPATAAQLNLPSALAIDERGVIYIADALNHRIRKVENGIITTVAGNGVLAEPGSDGPATQTPLAFPEGVAIDSSV